MLNCITKLGEAAVIGENGMGLNQSVRSKSCKAETTTQCLELSNEDFINKIQYFEYL
jgi:hypothetical protein